MQKIVACFGCLLFFTLFSGTTLAGNTTYIFTCPFHKDVQIKNKTSDCQATGMITKKREGANGIVTYKLASGECIFKNPQNGLALLTEITIGLSGEGKNDMQCTYGQTPRDKNLGVIKIEKIIGTDYDCQVEGILPKSYVKCTKKATNQKTNLTSTG